MTNCIMGLSWGSVAMVITTFHGKLVSFAKQLKNSSDVPVYNLREKKNRFNLKFEWPFI